MDTYLLALNALLLAGLYIRSWFQWVTLSRIDYSLFQVDENNREEMEAFMESFAEAFNVFMEESKEQSGDEIRRWDEGETP